MQMTQRIVFHITLLLMTFSLPGCREREHDARLMAADDMMSDSPEAAIDSLGKVDYALLDERDRHFYDFLSVKAADKAYIKHERDSLILDVVGYYSSHRGAGLYPEALYYAGRVYSDLGDYPAALRYYQDALDELDDDDVNLDLKANMLSQTGRLLNQLRLYRQSIPYIEKSIAIDKQLSDIYSLAYDTQLLGAVYYHLGDYDMATEYINEALKQAETLSSEDKANIAMYLADIQFEKEDIPSALSTIRGILDSVSPLARNRALACASQIYYAAGIMDTAYIYANELIRSRNFNNKKTGYNIILSPGVSDFIPNDSLKVIVNDYAKLLNDYLEMNGDQAALMQDSYYNYQSHVKERDKARENKNKVVGILTGVIILALCLLTCLFYLRYKSSVQLLKLQRAMSLIQELRTMRTPDVRDNESDENSENKKGDINKYEIKIIRDNLLKEAQKIVEESQRYVVPEEILQSDGYKRLQKLISENEYVVPKAVWKKLQEAIESVSPEFESKLQAISDERLTESDFHTAILVKCKVPPTQMKNLLSVTNGAVISRREYLGNKIFGKKVSVKIVDAIIRIL